MAWSIYGTVRAARRERYIAGLRKLIAEREEMLEFALGAAYARGWNDRMHFGLPMNLARVTPPEERSN